MTYGFSGRKPERIAIVRALAGLGDMLCAVPALRAVRGALPDTEIVLIGVPEGRAIIERFPQYVNRVMEVPSWPGVPEAKGDVRRVPAFLATALAEQFDVAIQMHGNGSAANHLTALLGAPVIAGYYLPGTWCPDHDRFLPWTGRQSEPRRWLDLVAHLGLPLRGEYLEFPISEDDNAAFERLCDAYDLEPKGYVCVHPGAAMDRRCWPPEMFARVADNMVEQGLRVVLTGTLGDRHATAAVQGAMRTRATDLTGRTDLGTLGALLNGARLLVCNDTGVSHVAAALGVPSVVVFTGSDPARWAPVNRRLHHPVLDAPSGQRAGGWMGCADTAEAVLREADDLLLHGRAATNNRPLLANGGWS